MESMDDDLAQRVMRLTWRSLAADAAEHGAASGSGPQRFSTPAALHGVRQAIVAICHEAEASESLREYFSTRWLEQFAPRLV